MHFDPSTCQCRIFTRRQGMLARLGHDLELAPERFAIEIDERPLTIRARFATDSIRVVSASQGGQPTRVSDADKATIERDVAELLEHERHPEVVFHSTSIRPKGTAFIVEGELAIRDRMRRIMFNVAQEGDRQIARVTLHQPDWGIEVFSAFLGALKVHPDVSVVVSLPAVSTRELSMPHIVTQAE